MTGRLGERLKRQRERQGLSLTAIAETTKIKASLLEELERDDISHWPAGIFRRSYVRAYAQAIGLEPDPVVREFLTLHPEPVEEVASDGLARTADPAGRRRPPTRLSYLLSSAINALPSLRGTSVPQAAATATDTEPADEQPLLDFPNPVVQPGFTEPGSHLDPVDDVDITFDQSDHDIDAFALPLMLEPQPDVTAHEEPATRISSPAADRALDLEAIADLCTRLGRAGHVHQVEQFMERAAGLLGAIGVILWTWDSESSALQPSLSHGYSAELLACIPPVTAQSDNAIASAFRSTRTCIIAGDDQGTGAVAVPLMTPFGCAGVLAAEFRDRGEQHEWVRAALTIFGAQLSTLVGQPPVIRTATA